MAHAASRLPVWLIAVAVLMVVRRRIAPGSLPLSHLFEKLRQWFRLPSTKLALHSGGQRAH